MTGPNVELLASAGYAVEHNEPIDRLSPLEQHYRDLPGLRTVVPWVRSRLLTGLPELLAIHFLLEARPSTS